MRPSVRKRARAATIAVVAMLAVAGMATPVAATQHQSEQRDGRLRAGYSTTGRYVTEVSASWVQPEVDCSATPHGRFTIEVALERPGFHDAITIGIATDCVQGQPELTAWFKEPRHAPYQIDEPLQIGHHMSAHVAVELSHGLGRALGGMDDDDYGWSAGIFGASGLKGFGHATGAVLVRAAQHEGTKRMYPLADFGTVYFTDAAVDKAPIGDGETVAWRMANGHGLVRATPSGLNSDGSFAVNWRAR